MAMAGAFIGALIGGLVWGLIAKLTGYESGFVAWGIGGAVGYGALVLSNGAKGSNVQVAAVAASVFGIFLGKYLSFITVWNELMAEGLDTEAAEMQLSVLSGLPIFMEFIGEMVGPLDALWVFLAVSTAWKMVGESSD